MEESFSNKKRKGRSGFSIPKDDVFSKLPDIVISQILLDLSTKDVVRTSPLSTRWIRLWLSIPGLDLASSQFPNYNAFVGFVDRFLDLAREENCCLQKLKLSITKDTNDPPCISRWIDFVVRGKLQHLDVECGPFMDPFMNNAYLEVMPLLHSVYLEVMPLSLYICETLIYLRLQQVAFRRFESVSLPRLKTLCLEDNVYTSDAALELLISSCLVLEDLSIVRRPFDDNLKVLRVRSRTLTSLSVGFSRSFGEYWRELSSIDIVYSELLIDAPTLKYLYLNDEVSESKIINNLGSLVKVNFDGCFDIQYHSDGAGLSKNQMARNFFTGISRVEDMISSKNTMMFFSRYLKVEQLPQFCNLSSLEAEFCSTDVEILPTFLESCPNLKSIVLDLTHTGSRLAPISFSSVPQCLLSSLEYVEIKSVFKGRFIEYQVARYFVKNSRVLKKLLVHLGCSMQRESLVILRALLALPRPSTACQIVYVADDDC